MAKIVLMYLFIYLLVFGKFHTELLDLTHH